MHRARIAFLTLLLPLAACHSSSSGSDAVGCPSGASCSEASGATRPTRADGTVDVTVPEIWPSRVAEPAPLTPDEVGLACSVLARCAGKDDAERFELLGFCVSNGDFGWAFWEQRAVPTVGKNERFTFEARAAIAHQDDCAAVLATTTPRPSPIYCEEDGCWWMDASRPLPTVTCAGDVATLSTEGQTWTRDCSHGLAQCDPGSPTGCTDRPPLGCDPKANDRCDGDVHIGCDRTGRVSFRDCARVNGTCAIQGTSAVCVPKATECDAAPTCTGNTLSLCVAGTKTTVPIASLGIAACPTP